MIKDYLEVLLHGNMYIISFFVLRLLTGRLHALS